MVAAVLREPSLRHISVLCRIRRHWCSPCRPDALTCSFLKACARVLAQIESFQMHAQVLKCGVVADVYAKCGELDSVGKLFDEMSRRDIASWNALIAGLAQGNQPYEALKLLSRMRKGNDEGGVVMLPNEVTLGAPWCSLGVFDVLEEEAGSYDEFEYRTPYKYEI